LLANHRLGGFLGLGHKEKSIKMSAPIWEKCEDWQNSFIPKTKGHN
jgi:hypothetical protein